MKVLHSICQQLWKTRQWPQVWKRSVFIQISKKGNAKECSNYCTIALILFASKVVLKTLQARLQQDMNHEHPDDKVWFKKGREPEIKLPASAGSLKKQESSIKLILLLCWHAKAFDCVDHNKLWKILKDSYTIPPDVSVEKSVCSSRSNSRSGHGTTAWFQIRKGVCQGCVFLPCLFNVYTEYIMRNARLDEAQAGIKIAGRNINNLRYANDTTLMAEREELKSSWWKWKRRVKKRA